MMDSERQQTFAKMKTEGLARKCKQCEWKFTCYGECPRNRFVKEDGEAGINYLCPGYVAFFTHVAPYMDMMKAKLDAGLPPADIMKDLG